MEGQSPSLKPTRKPVFGWLGLAGYTKKRVNLRDSSKLDPLIFTLFFYPLRGCDHASVIGLPPACVAAPAGERRNASAKRAGFHTIAPPQRRILPRSFCRSKMAELTHKTPKRQSGRQSRPGLRSKLKRREAMIGASLLAAVIASRRFNQLPRLKRRQPPPRLFSLVLSLAQRKYTSSPCTIR